jgi:hypothetical protein
LSRRLGHWEKLLEGRSAIESTIAGRACLAGFAQGAIGVIVVPSNLAEPGQPIVQCWQEKPGSRD